MDKVIDKLLTSDEPAVRFKVLANLVGKDLQSAEIQRLQQEIKASARVQRLLSERDTEGNIPYHPYAKWYGAHWVLADLADIGYPAGDKTLVPLREQVYQWLFGQKHQEGIKTINGRVRRHASQEGNALYYLLALGLADERTDDLATYLVKWQWPDGGWNCDKNPEATNSSFMESLIPLRGLALHGRITGNPQSLQAAERAAEIFLKRKLYRAQGNGRIIKHEFTKLHYPCYWHYDILFGLKVMAEAGFINDPRCQAALDLLATKQMPGGGFPAEKKYYRVTDRRGSGRSLVDWGGTSKKRMNEYVTVDALAVLRAAGRMQNY